MKIRPLPSTPFRASGPERLQASGEPTPEARAAAAPRGPAPTLIPRNFTVEEGGQQNFFTSGGESEAQVVVKPEEEVVAAFPAENTGISFWFGPGTRVRATGAPRALEMEAGQGLEIPLRSETPRLVITDAVLGSIRTIRERHHRTPELAAIQAERQEFAQHATVPPGWVAEQPSLTRGPEGSRLSFTWTDLEGREYRGSLDVPPEVKVSRKDGAFVLEGDQPFGLTMQSAVPHRPLNHYAPEELLSPAAFKLMENLQGPALDRSRKSLQALGFLATREKFMAGSWRFMTYFGRDTMLSLMLLKPALQPSAYADGMQSVLDRLSPKGDVAHEEDLGPWAARRRLADLVAAGAAPLSGPLAPAVVHELSRPIYDYKMVDDDFLLPVSLLQGFDDPAALAEFASRPSAAGESNLDRIVRNMDFVLQRAEPFATASRSGEPREELFQHTMKLVDGQMVGDWRDSNEGLGRGRYPGSVNVDLVPTAVRAVARLAELLPPKQLHEAIQRVGVKDLESRLFDARDVADEWDSAGDAYRVELNPEQVRSRLQEFMDRAPLGAEEKAFYLARPVGKDGPTLGEFLAGGSVPPALESGLRFMALSLDGDGHPVQVLNSDASFRVFLGDPPERDVKDVLTALELEYPVGLMTPVGPVVSNPAYSPDPVHREQLSRIAYHGAVIWSWQSQMLRAGLVRQLERFEDRPELAGRLRTALDRLDAAEQQAGDLANSELWTHKVEGGRWTAVAFGGENSNDNTEANTAQLWSTVYPAILIRERAAGLER